MKSITQVILVSSLLTISGCTSAKQRIQKHIGIVVYDGNDTFISSLNDEIVSLGNQDNYLVTTYDSERSQINQNEQVRQLISDGVDVLCVNLVDRTSTSTIIHVAQKANVPVIFFNREPVESDLNRWDQLYYVGADAEESGRLQGQLTASYIMMHPDVDTNNDGIIQYYILEGEPGHQDAIVRSETATSTLEEAGIPLEKVGYAICDWQKDEAYKQMIKKIKEDTHLELIIANNDEMASGAISAYEDENISSDKKPIIVGIDGTKHGLELVKSHKMIGTVYNDYKGQAEAVFTLANKIIAKDTQDISKYTRLPYQKITYDNIDDFATSN